MMTAMAGWLMLLLLQQPAAGSEPDFDEAVRKGVAFPAREEVGPWCSKGANHREALDYFLDPKEWARALRQVNRRTGLFAGRLDIRVEFASLEPGRPAHAMGGLGKGVVRFDVVQLAEYWRTRKSFEASRKGRQVVIPPASAIGILAHELTHCFQSGHLPEWFLEGMAAYAAEDPHVIAVFRRAREKVRDIEEGVEIKLIYARGWAFFEYFEAAHGRDKLLRLFREAVAGSRPLRDLAAELSGAVWEDVKKAERSWSTRWLAEFRIPQ